MYNFDEIVGTKNSKTKTKLLQIDENRPPEMFHDICLFIYFP